MRIYIYIFSYSQKKTKPEPPQSSMCEDCTNDQEVAWLHAWCEQDGRLAWLEIRASGGLEMKKADVHCLSLSLPPFQHLGLLV